VESSFAQSLHFVILCIYDVGQSASKYPVLQRVAQLRNVFNGMCRLVSLNAHFAARQHFLKKAANRVVGKHKPLRFYPAKIISYAEDQLASG
jgi:hypothetical protein